MLVTCLYPEPYIGLCLYLSPQSSRITSAQNINATVSYHVTDPLEYIVTGLLRSLCRMDSHCEDAKKIHLDRALEDLQQSGRAREGEAGNHTLMK